MLNLPLVFPQIVLHESLGIDFYKKVLNQALDFRKSASRPKLNAFDEVLRKSVQMPAGFRNFSKAPKERIVPAILKHFSCCLGVTETIVELWVESSAELSAAVITFLEEESPSVLGALDTQEGKSLSVVARSIVKDFKILHQRYDESEAVLMMAYHLNNRFCEQLTRDQKEQSPVAGLSNECAQSDTLMTIPHDTELRTNLERTMSTLSEIRDDLVLISSEAKDWEQLEVLLKEMVAIVERKRQESDAERRKLDTALDLLRQGFSPELEAFGRDVPQYSHSREWSSRNCKATDITEALEKVMNLSSVLDEYKLSSAQSEKTLPLSERQALREKLTKLEVKIEQINLDRFFYSSAQADPSSVHEVNEATERTEEPLAEQRPLDGRTVEDDGLSIDETTHAAEAEVDSPKAEGISFIEGRSMYGFSSDLTSTQIASLIRSGHYERSPEALRDLVWRLLFEQDFGPAYHLCRSLESSSPELKPRLADWLVRAIVVGP